VRSSVMHALAWSRRTQLSRESVSGWYPSASPVWRAIPRWELTKLTTCTALSITATAVLATFLAPTSAADPTTHLKSEIDAARSESGCPPLQSDPRLNNVSQRVAHEVDDYVRHVASSLPTTGENDLFASGDGGVLRVMREAGYHTNKVKLLQGYGDYQMGGTGGLEAKAIRATVLQGLGFEALPDCGYKKYGLSAINDDSSQGSPSTPPRTYVVTAVVLAGDA
jgi:hypothetical protein